MDIFLQLHPVVQITCVLAPVIVICTFLYLALR